MPTKDRSYHLSRRLPIWIRQGFDEVIVVDSSLDKTQRDANRTMCEAFGAKYAYAVVNRSKARNLGARYATGHWVFFTDDDLWGSAVFHREVMDRLVEGREWLKSPTSQVITVFNRRFFLNLGGYDEGLVLGEDDELTARTVTRGRGGVIDGVFEGIAYAPDKKERSLDFKRRLSNHIEYSYTLWTYLDKVENPAKFVLGWLLSLLRTTRELREGDLRVIPYLLGASGGLVFGFLSRLVRGERDSS